MNQSNTPVTYDEHDDTGKFTPTYTPEDFLNALAELGPSTTAEVAEYVECAHRTALHHLNALEDEDRVDSRPAGRAKLWMITGGSERQKGDTDVIQAIRDHLQRALDELPPHVPGRSAVEDAFAELDRNEE